LDGVYDWYRRGVSLLDSGRPHAAAAVLERAVSLEPAKGSIREGLGRAYYAIGRFSAALEQFASALDLDPVNDYAHFGAGLALGRLGRLVEAIGHLKMAAAMRPGLRDYLEALAAHEGRLKVRFS
jgi:tetratricopeptide (TPR) repeat protein